MSDDLRLRIAIAAAAARAARARQAAPPDPNRGFGPFAARGVIDMLASPVDLATYPGRAIGRAMGQDVTAPSTMIADLARGLGMRVAEEGVPAETRGERMGEGLGAATGFLLPGAGLVAGAARVGGPVLRGAAETIRAPFIRTPGAALTAEAAAGLGAGYLGYEAEQAAEGTAVPPDLARLGGELAGGLTGAAIPAATGAAVRGVGSVLDFIGLSGVRRLGTQILDPSEAARERASVALRAELSGAPEEALARLADDSILDLSPAQRVGQPALLMLEERIMRGNPALRAQYRERLEAAQVQTREEFGAMGESGSIRDTVRAMEDWTTTARQALEQTVVDARQAAEQAALRAGPRGMADAADLSAAFRSELDAAYTSVRAEESSLWGQVPLDVMAGTDASTAQYFDTLQQATRVRAGQIPAVAQRFLDPESPDYFGGGATAREMQALSSQLREEARIARSQGQAFTAKMADDLAEAVTRDLEAVPGVGGPLEAARSFSRVFNEVYRQGSVAEVLGTTRAGGDRVSPEETLSRLIGGTGERLVARSQDVEAAVGPAAPAGGARPQAMSLAGDYLRREFADTLQSESGDFRLGPAERFVAQRREFLDRYPQLATLFDDAISAARAADTTRGTVKDGLAAVGRSPAQRLVDAPVHREFWTILDNSQNPAFEFSELMSIAQQSGPEAVDGLRRAATSFLLDGARAVDDRGAVTYAGASITEALMDPRTLDAMSEVLTPDQLSRVSRIASELSRFELSQVASRQLDQQLLQPDTAENLLSVVARVAGAALGRRLTPPGYGTIQNPTLAAGVFGSIARRFSRNEAKALLVDAVTANEDLFRALLTYERPGPEFDRAREVLSLWMANNLSQTANEIDDAMADFEEGLGLRPPRQPLRIQIPGP